MVVVSQIFEYFIYIFYFPLVACSHVHSALMCFYVYFMENILAVLAYLRSDVQLEFFQYGDLISQKLVVKRYFVCVIAWNPSSVIITCRST